LIIQRINISCFALGYHSKPLIYYDAAVKEMKERIWKILVEKGHRENDEQVKWDIREE
jgi:hypothetical protein